MAIHCIIPRSGYWRTCEDLDEGIRGAVDSAGGANTVDSWVERLSTSQDEQVAIENEDTEPGA